MSFVDDFSFFCYIIICGSNLLCRGFNSSLVLSVFILCHSPLEIGTCIWFIIISICLLLMGFFKFLECSCVAGL
uniref:Uncharacterized protein n=1 Tax=Nelumbo nucifera TaxID=4432 RepID=A0A822YQD2_NELNU|nr:TPA_asm: hypothetical protein HUJ06_007025 [Nelumbo nucifera]